MKTTQNYGLRKPEPTDFYNVDDFNFNADVIDTELFAVKQKADQTESDLVAHLNEKASLSTYGHIQHGVITATILASDWVGDTAPYTNTVSAPGVLSTDNPIIDVVDVDGTMQEAWSLIYRAVTADGSITFYASKKPETDLTVQIKVVR